VSIITYTGSTHSAGLSDFKVRHIIDNEPPLQSVLEDGVAYRYRARYANGRIGYEKGTGIWTAATGSLSRDTVTESSKSDQSVSKKLSFDEGEKLLEVIKESSAALREVGELLLLDAEKPPGEPYFIVATGQSNVIGLSLYTDEAPVINPRVFDWQAPVGDPTNYAFAVADPYRTSNYSASIWMVGMRGGGYGNLCWNAADALQKMTGRDVYMLQVAKPSQSYVLWFSGSGADLALAAQTPPALAAAGVTKADLAIWLQGESDAFVSTADSGYAKGFTGGVLPAAATAGWYTPNETALVMIDIGDSWGDWSGIKSAYELVEGKAEFVQTAGLLETQNAGHFNGDAAAEIGRRVIQRYMGADYLAKPPVSRRTTNFRMSLESTGTANAILINAPVTGSFMVNVWCHNTAKTKFWTALVHVWNRENATYGATVINDEGEAGFTVLALPIPPNFLFACVGTAGEDWHWTADILNTVDAN
jgi:hypothetical protein